MKKKKRINNKEYAVDGLWIQTKVNTKTTFQQWNIIGACIRSQPTQ